jgi:Restriction endonuclease
LLGLQVLASTAVEDAKRCGLRLNLTRMARSEAWHKYQRDAADLFRGLGLEAEVDARVQGARNHHDLDVLVTFRSFGIDHRWIVECKCWKSRVKKAAVLTLDGVIKDVGADLGILLTESGAQSGAITATRFSNIRITNLDDLRSNASTDLLDLQWNAVFARTAEATHLMGTLWSTLIPRSPSPGRNFSLKPGVSMDDFLSFRARLSAVETGASRARLGRFPAPYDLDVQHDRYLGADGMEQFVSGAAQTLDEVEAWLGEPVGKPWASQGPSPAGA